MNAQDTSAALASALPAGIAYPPEDSPAGKAFSARWTAAKIAEFQAERLAESGYVLIYVEGEVQ